MTEKCLELKKIRKSFVPGEDVLDGIDLSVGRGEFITLLGSSGCGKTTTLRIIAGLEHPDEGQVFLDGKDVTNLEPDKRDVNTVFQNYALFPHMNVADNIGYGLKLKRIPKNEIRKRVSDMLELVQLSGFEKRKPSELSGGQRQRVAIARSLINNPTVLLLDEPLGALDLQLRRTMQLELKRLQKKLGITFIYITHDQEEAINMSDRIAVMNHGSFEQIGTPDEIYNHPRTSYVATFVGNANILQGNVVGQSADTVRILLNDGEVMAELPGRAEKMSASGLNRYEKKASSAQTDEENDRKRSEGQEMVDESAAADRKPENAMRRLRPGQRMTIAVRSENIRLGAECEHPLSARVREKNFAGGQLRLALELSDGTEVIASRYGIDYDVDLGDEIFWDFLPKNAVLVDLSEDVWEDENE